MSHTVLPPTPSSLRSLSPVYPTFLPDISSHKPLARGGPFPPPPTGLELMTMFPACPPSGAFFPHAHQTSADVHMGDGGDAHAEDGACACAACAQGAREREYAAQAMGRGLRGTSAWFGPQEREFFGAGERGRGGASGGGRAIAEREACRGGGYTGSDTDTRWRGERENEHDFLAGGNRLRAIGVGAGEHGAPLHVATAWSEGERRRMVDAERERGRVAAAAAEHPTKRQKSLDTSAIPSPGPASATDVDASLATLRLSPVAMGPARGLSSAVPEREQERVRPPAFPAQAVRPKGRPGAKGATKAGSPPTVLNGASPRKAPAAAAAVAGPHPHTASPHVHTSPIAPAPPPPPQSPAPPPPGTAAAVPPAPKAAPRRRAGKYTKRAFVNQHPMPQPSPPAAQPLAPNGNGNGNAHAHALQPEYLYGHMLPPPPSHAAPSSHAYPSPPQQQDHEHAHEHEQAPAHEQTRDHAHTLPPLVPVEWN